MARQPLAARRCGNLKSVQLETRSRRVGTNGPEPICLTLIKLPAAGSAT